MLFNIFMDGVYIERIENKNARKKFKLLKIGMNGIYHTYCLQMILCWWQVVIINLITS